jgi:hypothetical protein
MNITEEIQNYLPLNSFVFNPSMARIKKDKYLMSVRSYRYKFDVPLAEENHPWYTNWSGQEDMTYIFPAIYNENEFKCLNGENWPLEIKGVDARIFYFMRVDDKNIYIITYNTTFRGYKELILKGGNPCDDYCTVIAWGMLFLDINTLEYTYNPGQSPLCLNISNPVEKNWSLWKLKYDNLIHLIVSYSLVPQHNAFSFRLNSIENNKIIADTDCIMVTPFNKTDNNLFNLMEEYFNNELYISLSTPSYLVNDYIYQSVGHVKVKINYLKKLVSQGDNSKLAKFSKKHLIKDDRIIYHPTYIYFMFIFRFKVVLPGEQKRQEIVKFNSSSDIHLTGTNKRITADIVSVSPAFVLDTDDYNYFLNFPSGMVLNKNNTLITYGNGDRTSNILSISNEDIEEFLIPVDNITVKNFKFLTARVKNGILKL